MHINSHFFVYTQNVNWPELARKLIFICSPLAGQYSIIVQKEYMKKQKTNSENK